MDVSLNAHNHDDFLEQFPLGSFLQGRFWKHFLSLQGKKNWQLSVYDDSHLIAHCLLYATNMPFGKSYVYAPRGPIFLPTLPEEDRRESLELILSQIRDITIATRKREEIFCRIEPNIQPSSLEHIPMQPSEPVQPQTTMYLELNKTPDELFASFKEKTRYNIRLAQKKEIKTFWSQDRKGLKIFLSQLSRSAQRKRIRIHERLYYDLLLKAGREFDAVFINWAEYNGKPVAANMYIAHRPTMTYVHGGFNYRYRSLMAPYVLQWEAIKFAYEHELSFFDFWGYTPDDGSKPSWEGFSKFKAGFNGTVHTSPGAFDYIYNPVWYNLYTKVKNFRRLF